MTNKNVVWITGASSGIGKAMAFEWARLGYRVALSARRKQLLEEVATKIIHSGGEALVVPVDILDEKSIEEAVQNIISTWHRIDVAVANAGFRSFWKHREADRGGMEQAIAGQCHRPGPDREIRSRVWLELFHQKAPSRNDARPYLVKEI